MEKLRIDSVHVSHIGAFNELHLKFPEKVKSDAAEIHIFSGENGTGKSTLLEIISSFDSLSQILTSKTHSGQTAKVEIAFTYKGGNSNIIELYTNQFAEGTWRSNVLPRFLSEYYSKIRNHLNVTFNFGFFAYSGYRRLTSNTLGAIQELNTSPLDHALQFDHSINPQQLLQWIANTKTKEALSRARGDNSKADQYHLALKRIEDVISEITDTKISFVMEDNPLAVKIEADGLNLQFSSLPDGLKSIISWLADLLMKLDRLHWEKNLNIFDRNFVLLLDEIDVHLHPKWQRKILPVIQKLFRNAQIFISTHSPFIIGSIDSAWIYRFEKRGAFSQLASPPFLSEDANSYRMILEEVFGINKQFGINIEKRLDRFYQIKNELLRGANDHIDEFRILAKDLAAQSNELENIIGMELKQVKKIIGYSLEDFL